MTSSTCCRGKPCHQNPIRQRCDSSREKFKLFSLAGSNWVMKTFWWTKTAGSYKSTEAESFPLINNNSSYDDLSSEKLLKRTKLQREQSGKRSEKPCQLAQQQNSFSSRGWLQQLSSLATIEVLFQPTNKTCCFSCRRVFFSFLENRNNLKHVLEITIALKYR